MTLGREPTLPRLRSIAPTEAPSPRLPVVGSKLEPPPFRDGTVRRDALVQRLLASRRARTVLIRAPTGYGKTTLLAQWAAADERDVAWVSLDRHDDDPVVLLTYLAAAVNRIEPVHPQVVRVLRSPSASLRTRILPSLAVTLSALRRPILLILDDVHELRRPDTIDAVILLVRSLPDGSQLALAARGEPSLPIPRLRARGELLEIGPQDLALDLDEASRLMTDAGFAISTTEVADLHRSTEGWPAGLYLAALATQAAGTATSGPPAFSDRDRFVAEYLRAEVLSGLSTRELRFLTQTSVLDRLCAPLCDAVTGRRRSASMLASIERANLFLVPLDREGQWFRFHGLFRATLAAELERRQPGLRGELLVRAADWCEGQGLFEEALGYVVEAGDVDRSADLFERVALPIFRSGRLATDRGWLDRFDAATLERHPATAALAGLGSALVGDAIDADRWVSEASRSLPDDAASRAVGASGTSAASLVAYVRAFTCPDGADRMLADATTSVGLEADWSPWRAGALTLQGVADALVGDVARARTVLAAAVEAATSLGAHLARSIALAELGVLAIDRGDWTAAEGYAAKARSVITAAGLADYPVTALAFAVTARTMAHRGDVIRARADLARVTRMAPVVTYAIPWLAIQVRVESARVQLVLGEFEAARSILREIDAILDQRPDIGTLRQKVDGLRQQIDRSGHVHGTGSLTEAELRLVPLLPTHLSFIEIAELQVLSPNTVKTQAISIYRKLGASSRSDAVARARDLGLLDP